jgi:hypothetical protein
VIRVAAGVLWEMNTLIKRQKLLASILSLACTVAMPTTSRSQAQATDTPVQLSIEHGQLATSPPQEATLSNVVKDLQHENPTLNIVLPADLGQIKIGDLQLHDAPPDLALRALCVASGNHFSFNAERSLGNALFIIEKNQPPGPPPPDVMVEAFNLTGYFKHLNLDLPGEEIFSASDAKKGDKQVNRDYVVRKLQEVVTNTIKDQQEYSGESLPRPPVFNFYNDADVFVVIGSPDAANTARKIINALPGEGDGRAVVRDGFRRPISGQTRLENGNQGGAEFRAGSQAPPDPK